MYNVELYDIDYSYSSSVIADLQSKGKKVCPCASVKPTMLHPRSPGVFLHICLHRVLLFLWWCCRRVRAHRTCPEHAPLLLDIRMARCCADAGSAGRTRLLIAGLITLCWVCVSFRLLAPVTNSSDRLLPGQCARENAPHLSLTRVFWFVLKVMCYISAGTSEDFREDINLFPAIAKGGIVSPTAAAFCLSGKARELYAY